MSFPVVGLVLLGGVMRVALVQMRSGADVAENLSRAEGFFRQAASNGADLVCFPEYFVFYGPDHEMAAVANEYGQSVLARFSQLAKEIGCQILLGSVLLPEVGGKCENTSVLLNPAGEVAARYIKRHLFDVDLPGKSYRESAFLVAGDAFVTAKLGQGWTAGLSICFDVRFASHYAELRRAGANVMFVPAAFTAQTGQAHWEVLLRARAIEMQSYVVAPAQAGFCTPQKECHGHSMIVDPWGKIVVEIPKDAGEAIAAADLDLTLVENVRRSIPL